MVILYTKNQQSNGAYKILANIYFQFFFFFKIRKIHKMFLNVL